MSCGHWSLFLNGCIHWLFFVAWCRNGRASEIRSLRDCRHQVVSKPSRHMNNTKVNSGFHPSGVGRSTACQPDWLGLRWGRVCVGWQAASVGTNRIHGKKCMISWQNFLNVSNFTEKSRKELKKFAGNSRAPQTLFRGAALLQTKKFQNNEYLLH